MLRGYREWIYVFKVSYFDLLRILIFNSLFFVKILKIIDDWNIGNFWKMLELLFLLIGSCRVIVFDVNIWLFYLRRWGIKKVGLL